MTKQVLKRTVGFCAAAWQASTSRWVDGALRYQRNQLNESNPVCQHRSNRSNGWLNYIGYTRERTVTPKTGSIEAVETAAREIQAKIDAMKQTSGKRK